MEKRRYATGASAAGMPAIAFILYSIIERDLLKRYDQASKAR